MGCERCKYLRTYEDPIFKPILICTRCTNLKEAIEAVIDSKNCECKEEFDFTQLPKVFNELAKACEKMGEAFKKLAEELDEKK